MYIINLRSWKLPACHNDTIAHALRYHYPLHKGIISLKTWTPIAHSSDTLKFSTFQIGIECAKRSLMSVWVPSLSCSLSWEYWKLVCKDTKFILNRKKKQWFLSLPKISIQLIKHTRTIPFCRVHNNIQVTMFHMLHFRIKLHVTLFTHFPLQMAFVHSYHHLSQVYNYIYLSNFLMRKGSRLHQKPYPRRRADERGGRGTAKHP